MGLDLELGGRGMKEKSCCFLVFWWVFLSQERWDVKKAEKSANSHKKHLVRNIYKQRSDFIMAVKQLHKETA